MEIPCSEETQGITCGERVGMRRESIFQTQCHCGRWWACHPNAKEWQEWAVKSLKKIPSVKHRAPWKQPFQLVPDWLEIQIKRSFQTMLKDNLLSIQISPTVPSALLLCKVALPSLTVQVSHITSPKDPVSSHTKHSTYGSRTGLPHSQWRAWITRSETLSMAPLLIALYFQSFVTFTESFFFGQNSPYWVLSQRHSLNFFRSLSIISGLWHRKTLKAWSPREKQVVNSILNWKQFNFTYNLKFFSWL